MTFTATYVYTVVLVAPSLGFMFGNFCRNAFIDEGFDVANKCNKSILTNLTTYTREFELELVDATEDGSQIQLAAEFVFHCCFYSQPYCPLIRWFKDGVEISKDVLTKRISEDGRNLKGFARENDGGNYMCTATTPYRGEHQSWLFAVSVNRICDDKKPFTVETSPDNRVVRMKKGSRQVLVWNFICSGSFLDSSEVCRTGDGTLISKYHPNTYYNISDYYRSPDEVNTVSLRVTITIFNFTRSENITCTTNNGKNSPSATFILVEKECEGKPYIIPEYTDKKLLKIGDNHTMTCTILCLKRRNFNDPVWRNGRGEIITNNSVKYLLTSRDLSRNGFADFSKPSYEMSLTVMNFNRSENFSCYVSEGNFTGKTFRLVADSGREPVIGKLEEESFFNEKGVWIVIGGSLLLCLGFLLLCYRKKVSRKPRTIYRPNKEEVAARYDAFISYSEADGGSFVRSKLKPMLEEECGYTLSLHYREFVPGKPIIDNIIESIYHSRRIVTVVTPEFLDSEWCKFEVDQENVLLRLRVQRIPEKFQILNKVEQRLHRAIAKPNTLIVVMLNEIPPSQLPKSLRAFLSDVTFLVWDEEKREEMRKKLKSALGPPFTVDHVDALEKGGSEVEIALAGKDADTCHLDDNGYPSNQQDVGSDNETVTHEV